MTFDGSRAAVKGEYPGDNIEKRAFAGTVYTEQTYSFHFRLC